MTLAIIFENKILMLISLLIGSVIFVNGWTDAPNAITSSVSTGALKMRTAVCIAAVFNFIGAFVMGIANTSVLESVGNITMMIGQGNNSLLILGASLASIIIWSVTAWYFGIPTSESHALISGILGAILACGGVFTNEGAFALKLSAIGLALSLPIGGGLGYVFGKITYNISLNKNNPKLFSSGQILGACAMSFMHGAQDSQKFAGVFVAAMIMSKSYEKGSGADAPLWLILVCAIVMALGTSVGGYRIIKKVGIETVELTPERGLAADAAAVVCMCLASLGGIPVSTTHTATASVVGAGLSGYPRKINYKSVREMAIAWVLTFPCCGFVSYSIVKIFLLFF